MAIVKMKHLRTAVPVKQRRNLLRELYSLGNVEINTLDETEELRELEYIRSRVETTGAARRKDEIKRALDSLSEVVPKGKKPFGYKQELTENELFDDKKMDKALDIAAKINRLSEVPDEIKSKKDALRQKIMFLKPWESYDLPLEYKGTKTVRLEKGSFPIGTDISRLQGKVEEIGPGIILEISRDADLIYVVVFIHDSADKEIMGFIRQNGFSRVDMKNYTGTAREMYLKLTEREKELDKEAKDALAELKAIGDVYELLEAAFDAFTVEESRDELLSGIGYTEKTAVLSGWVAEEHTQPLIKVLEKYDAVYDLSDPDENDTPPTVLKNSSAVAPLNAITEMYGMPKYDSIIDPNPFMLPFYVVFFGAIMADVMYGLLITVGCLAGLKLLKPKERSTMWCMMKLFTYCGVATMVFGVLFGGYFGDLINIATTTFLGKDLGPKPLWFNPIEDPMTMLIFSMVLGLIQIFAGMGVSGLRQIKEGKAFDAFCDVGSWYLVIAGPVAMMLGFKYWYFITGAGIAVMLIFGGRHKKGIMKIFGGFSQMYGIVSIASDMLSYSRIMALALSGAVVGSVVNKMGAMGGRSVMGVLLFIIAAVVGHVFNLAISVLGAYVHTSRLQYIEYFGRFYVDGGRIMKPLKNKTKYVNIKEQ